jgi:hypothetical protein
MSLRTIAAQLDQPHQGTVCWYKTISLTDDDREFLDGLLADTSISGAHIARILKEDGHQVQAHSLRSHRNKECRCWG